MNNFQVQYNPMLSFEEMAIRFLIAILLGAIIGLEREVVGKEAGIRTTMVVSCGASLFAMAAVTLPYLIAVSPSNLPDVIARNSGFLPMAANIVVGIGFLGAGIIIKDESSSHVRGLTTAALIWFAAAIGTLVGIGLIDIATFAALSVTLLLYILRKINLYERLHIQNNQNKSSDNKD